MKKIYTYILLLTFFLNICPFNTLSPAFASEQEITLKVVEGSVKVKTSADAPWTKVTERVNLTAGGYVNAGPGSSGVLLFPDGSNIRLYEKSMVRIMEIEYIQGGARNYFIRFLGKILVHAVETGKTDSTFLSNAPTTDITTYGKEYTAEIETNLTVKIEVLEGKAVPKEAFNRTGKIRDISIPNQTFTFEIETEDGKTGLLTVKVNPATVYFDGYEKYRKSGIPEDLGNLKDLEKGDSVIVYGDLISNGKVIDAFLIANKSVAGFYLLGGAAILGIILPLTLGGETVVKPPPVSPVQPQR